MRRYLTMSLLALFCASALGAGVFASVVANEGQATGPPEFVTICHAAGLAGTTHFVTLTLPTVAVFGQAGHFFENGTPQAGHEQDYLGPCSGDETTPTDTEPTTPTETEPPDDDPPPTTTTPTTTTPTTPTPPTGAASVICDRGSFVYRVSGTIDGQAADSVSPSTIPGNTVGTTNVTVTRGDTSFRTSVTTNGDCAPPTTTTSSTSTTASTTTPTTTTPTVTNPPAANSPQPKTPTQTTSTSVTKPKPKAPPKLTGNPKTDKCVDLGNGTMNCKGVIVTPGQG